jgi:hypothetical protein
MVPVLVNITVKPPHLRCVFETTGFENETEENSGWSSFNSVISDVGSLKLDFK